MLHLHYEANRTVHILL